MRVTMVKKRLLGGEPCNKCVQAEDMLKKAEAKPNADTKPLIDESKKYLAEARAHHENAKTKRDHGDAVRKAKFALALAEEAVTLQTP